MCIGGTTPPKPIPNRAVGRMPDAAGVSTRSMDNLLRRATMSATNYTGAMGATGAAPTRGVSLLGQ